MKPDSTQSDEPDSSEIAGGHSPAVEAASLSRDRPMATSTPGTAAIGNRENRAPRTPVLLNSSLAGRVPRTFAQIKGRRAVHAASSPRTVKTDRKPPIRRAPKTSAGVTKDSKTNRPPKDQGAPRGTSRALKRQYSPESDLSEEPSTSSQARDNTEGSSLPAKRRGFQVTQINMRNRAVGLLVLNLDQATEELGTPANLGQGENLDNVTFTEQMPARTEAETQDSATNTTVVRSPQSKNSCSIM